MQGKQGMARSRCSASAIFTLFPDASARGGARTHHRSHWGCLAFGAILMGLSANTRAWNYEEHFAITYASLGEACKSTQPNVEHGDMSVREARDRAVLCSDAAKLCLAHMAALAGDYVKTPRALVEDARKRKVLRRGQLDCTGFLTSAAQAVKVTALPQVLQPVPPSEDNHPKNKISNALPQCMAPEGYEWTPEVSFKLIDNPVRRGYRWVSLATRNAQHFQPASSQSFVAYAKKAAEQTTLEKRLAYQAFALHFLEDSFPAGHVGLDRPLDKSVDPDVPISPGSSRPQTGSYLLGRSQDYAHAYHDDLNHAGQALKTAEQQPNEAPWWFTYGDTQLCAPTIYLHVPASVAGETPEQSKALLNNVLTAVGGGPINSYQDRAFVPAAIEAIKLASTRSSDEPPVVLSLPRSGLTSFLQTSIASAVTADLADLIRQFSVCAWSQYCDKIEVVLTHETARGSSVQCDRGTPLPHAPDYVIFRCGESAAHVRAAAIAAQVSFLAVTRPDATASQTALAQALAEMPAKYSANDPKKAEGSSELNLENKVLYYKEFQPVDQAEPRLYESWGPGLTHFMGKRLNESMFSFGPSVEMEGCAACNVDLRIGVLSWHNAAVSAPLDTAITSFIYHPIAPELGRLITANLRLDTGFQGLWDGEYRRNVFAGAGLGVELPFGRYVVEATAMRDFHWNSYLHGVPTTTLGIGVRIPSISLSRSPQRGNSSN